MRRVKATVADPPAAAGSPAAAATVRLHLLGAPSVEIARQVLEPGSRKALALLAWLALEGRSTRSRLAVLFWPELNAASARRNLRRELHRLRSVGADAALQSNGDMLALDPAVHTDVQAFVRALDAGHLAAATRLYRGPLLDGFDLAEGGEFERWLAAQREQLALQHRHALQAQAVALEAAEHWRDALVLALRLIELDALQEQHFRRAMRLHQRLGEREAALLLFERCRQRLGRELGLRPMPETAALADEIRRGDGPAAPAADEPAPSPPEAAEAPTSSVADQPFIGRGALLDTLTRPTPSAGAFWLAGEPGVGKTRLALQAAQQHGPHAWVQALSGDAELPYATVARALRQRLTPQAAQRLPAWARAELARLLPDLAPAPVAPAADPQHLRAALLEAWQDLVLPGLRSLVFDDWHLADAASQALFPPGVAMGAVRLLVTLRPAALAPALHDSVQRACHAGAARWVEVAPLDVSEVGAWLRADEAHRGAAASRLLTQRLHEATGGNAFYLRELLQALPPHALAAGDAALPLPPTVRDAVLARLAALAVGTRRLLEAASLVDGSFVAEDLAGCTALTEIEGVAALEQALAHHVLQRDAEGRLHFRHQLLAEALAAGLTPERRRLMHRRIAAALEQRQAAPSRVAQQLLAAGNVAGARPWLIAAAAAAEALGDHDAALAAQAAALAGAPPLAEAAGIHLRRARVLQRAGRPREADTAFEAAEQAALQAGDGAAVMAAMLAKAEHWTCSSRLDEGLALVEGLLDDGLTDPLQQAEALEIRADVLLRRGDLPQAQAVIQDALQRLPPGPSPLRGRLLMALGRAAMYRAQFEVAALHFDKAMRVHAALGTGEGLAKATYMRGAADLNLGRMPQAAALLQRARRQAAAAGSVPVQRGAILNLVKILTQTGDVAAALQALAEGEALSPFYENRSAEAAFVQAHYYCQALVGETAAALALLPRVIATGDACEEPYWRVGARHLVVDLLLLTGDLDQASELLHEALALCGEATDEHHLPLVQAKLGWLELLQGRPADALARLQALGPIDAMATPEAQDVRRHAQAGAHLALGDPAAALALLATPERSSTEESKVLQWAVRLQAEAALGGPAPASLQAVQALLADAARLPALEAAELRRTLHQLQPVAG